MNGQLAPALSHNPATPATHTAGVGSVWNKAGAGVKAAAKRISKTARDVRDIKSKAQKYVLRFRLLRV